MKLLRETIRTLILENKKAVDSETMHPKIEAWLENKCKELGYKVYEMNRSDFPSDDIYVGEWVIDNAEEDMSSLIEPFREWFRRRGWNVLHATWNDMGGIGQLHISADKQANPKSSNKIWSMTDLGYEHMAIYHVTTKSNWKRIKRKGFVPSTKSSDGVTYGAQRNYFFLTKFYDWVDYQENIVNWFSNMFGDSKRDMMAGLEEGEDLVLVVLMANSYQSKRISANFYIDTEFGYGTGGVDTRGLGFDMHAVYTPTHLPVMGLQKVINL